MAREIGKRWLAVAASSVLTTLPNVAAASESAAVGVALDQVSCRLDEPAHIPLPVIPAANPERDGLVEPLAELVQLEIDNSFGAGCRIESISISGAITADTLPTLKLGARLLAERKAENPKQSILRLSSHGGLIVEAMKIGDFTASQELTAMVNRGSSCFSSCVLILAAASKRAIGGQVGIHRPFASDISTENLNYQEYLAAYDVVTVLMKQYLSKYGVSPALVDQMNVIPSDDIRILSAEELEGVGLGFRNIAAKEFEKARTIQICGEKSQQIQAYYASLYQQCRNALEGNNIDQAEVCIAELSKIYPGYKDEKAACDLRLSEFGR